MSWFTVMKALWWVLHVYLAARLVIPARGRGKRLLLGALAAVLAALPPFTMYLDWGNVDFPMKDAVRWAGYTSMGFSSFVLFLFLSEDLVRIGGWIARKLVRPRRPAGFDRDRRRFLRNTVNFGAVAAAGGLTAFEAGTAQNVPAVRRVTVPIRGLHPDLEGFSIAQISDLHVGPTIRRDYVEAVVRATNALGADMIAVTGDIVDGKIPEFGDDVAALRGLEAPRGVFFVTGNHEYYWDLDGWLGQYRSFGWDLLLNEHRVLERGAGRILLAGATDFRSGRYSPGHVHDPAGARRGAPETHVSILLAHQPKSIFAAAAAGYDVQISGHTHGGQYFPVSLLVRLFEPYVAGLHLHDGKTWIYVNSGTGYWGPPNRFGVPKEITLVRLGRG